MTYIEGSRKTGVKEVTANRVAGKGMEEISGCGDLTGTLTQRTFFRGIPRCFHGWQAFRSSSRRVYNSSVCCLLLWFAFPIYTCIISSGMAGICGSYRTQLGNLVSNMKFQGGPDPASEWNFCAFKAVKYKWLSIRSHRLAPRWKESDSAADSPETFPFLFAASF